LENYFHLLKTEEQVQNYYTMTILIFNFYENILEKKEDESLKKLQFKYFTSWVNINK
jgi:hypothetical protein